LSALVLSETDEIVHEPDSAFGLFFIFADGDLLHNSWRVDWARLFSAAAAKLLDCLLPTSPRFQ
jgi:hypothetical protein